MSLRPPLPRCLRVNTINPHTTTPPRLGMVLAKMTLKKEALSPLVLSVNKYPFNWSAWLEIIHCLSSLEMVLTPVFSFQVPLTDHFLRRHQVHALAPKIADGFMKETFLAQVYLEFHQSEATLDRLKTALVPSFPRSSFLLRQKALAHYYMRGIHHPLFRVAAPFSSPPPLFVISKSWTRPTAFSSSSLWMISSTWISWSPSRMCST